MVVYATFYFKSNQSSYINQKWLLKVQLSSQPVCIKFFAVSCFGFRRKGCIIFQ